MNRPSAQGVLRSVGINQDISSRDQFRALVDGADVSTTAGREQLAALLAAAAIQAIHAERSRRAIRLTLFERLPDHNEDRDGHRAA